MNSLCFSIFSLPSLIKKLLIFSLFFISIHAFGQDIYDAANSKKYADYLFKSKEYSRAAQEYERTCFLDSQNWDAHFYLMKSYRKSEQAAKGLAHYQTIYFRLPQNQISQFEHEKNINLFTIQPSFFIAKTEKDSMDELQYFKAPSLLLTHNWKASKSYLIAENYKEDKTLSKYYDNAVQGLNLSYKKPWLAGTMSTLVPGLGKVYTGYYKDGIIAFLVTGISAFQAIRGYNSKGLNSGIFILYSGVFTGFYLGNIYGSIKSARQKNRKLNEVIDQKTKAVFYEWAE